MSQAVPTLSQDAPWCLEPKWLGAEGYVRCKKCTLCLGSKASEWAGRLTLEMYTSGQPGAFLTLTYADEHLPRDSAGRGILKREDWTKFLKRLRKSLAKFDRKIRYFGCGEYGERMSNRPHFHAIILGLSFADEALVKQAWPFGFVKVREANVARCRYVSNYVVKNHAKERRDGRPPEFYSMSQSLGKSAIPVLAASFNQVLPEATDDVGRFWRQHGTERLIPRQILDGVRSELGIPLDAFSRNGGVSVVRPRPSLGRLDALRRAARYAERTGLRLRRRRNARRSERM